MQPLISIITPAYNSERFLVETLETVSKQTHTNWEHLVVVDGNSKDRTLEIAQEWARKDPRYKCIQDPRAKGAARNRNVGLEKAQGEYIAFLDADDLWVENKLEKQLAFMRDKKCDFSCAGFTRISEDGQVAGRYLTVPAEITYEDVLKNNPVGTLTVMISRAAAKVAKFKEVGWEDMGCWLEILRHGYKGYGLPESLGWYRIVKGSRSNNKFFAAKLRWQTLRQVESIPLLRALCYFASYMVTGIAKHAKRI